MRVQCFLHGAEELARLLRTSRNSRALGSQWKNQVLRSLSITSVVGCTANHTITLPQVQMILATDHQCKKSRSSSCASRSRSSEPLALRVHTLQFRCAQSRSEAESEFPSAPPRPVRSNPARPAEPHRLGECRRRRRPDCSWIGRRQHSRAAGSKRRLEHVGAGGERRREHVRTHTHRRWSARYQVPLDRATDANGSRTRRHCAGWAVLLQDRSS